MSRGKPMIEGEEPHLHPDGSPRLSKNKKRASKSPSRPNSPQTEQSSSVPAAIDPMLGGVLSRSKRIPVFVASLGNPKPYLNTLHSAGHTVLSCIAVEQGYSEWRPFAGGQIADKNLNSFSFTGGYKIGGGESLPTLWTSGSLMNVSGPAVKKAWLKWKQQHGLEKSDEARLVIVHDELEKDLGAVNVRTDPKASARGHNGLKSLMASMPNERFIRIGVGIGRPSSREKDAVSNYVLRQMTRQEKQALELAAFKVHQQIAEIEEGAIG